MSTHARHVATIHNSDDLLLRAGLGDQLAFACLYDQTVGRTFDVVRCVVANVDYCEDAVRSVYLEVWRTASRFDPSTASAAAWIATIAQRQTIDRLRTSPLQGHPLAFLA